MKASGNTTKALAFLLVTVRIVIVALAISVVILVLASRLVAVRPVNDASARSLIINELTFILVAVC